MSIGGLHVRFSLCYVDDLLADFLQQPQKSIQFVFQRLLVTCGSESRLISVHAADVLLSAVGLVSLPPAPRRALDDHSACVLLALILKFATEEQPGRTRLELNGASALFTAVVDRVSSIIQKISEEGGNQLVPLIETILNKIFQSVDQVHQCAFLVSLAVGEASFIVSSLLEQLLHNFFIKHVQKNVKCVLRIEFILRCLSSYIEGDFPNTCPLVVVRFVRQILSESNRVLLQPFIFRLLAKKGGVTSVLTEHQLRGQVKEVLDCGLVDTQPVRSALMESNRLVLVAPLQEAGSGCTSSHEVLKSLFHRTGLTEASSFTPSSVAAALLWIVDGLTKQGVQRHASFERAGPGVSDLDPSDDHLPWNGHVFADIVNQMNPALNWSEVIIRLDDDSFRIGSRAALRVLTETLNKGIQGRPFPVSLLYRKWNHQEGQLSWILRILENQDVFCLADHPHRPVHTGMLKNPPDENDRSVANWCCVDLIETLLSMASADPRLNSAVIRAVHPAMTTCPDVLLLSLFQIPPPITSIRQHIFQVLIPAIIIQHPNAVSVLNIGWNTDVLPRKVIHNSILSAFVSLYMKSPEDQQKLARILDIAHELKPGGLAELFSSSQLQFIVDLGCLASKRDYLKLEKWLEDKLQEHGQPLIKTVLCHMERRLPSTGSSNSLPIETFSILLAFVRNHLPMVAPAIRQQYTALTEQLKDIQDSCGSTLLYGAPMAADFHQRAFERRHVTNNFLQLLWDFYTETVFFSLISFMRERINCLKTSLYYCQQEVY